MELYDMAPAVMVPLFVFTFIAAIIIVPMILRSQDRARMHETLRRYHESGETPPPEILAALTARSSVHGAMGNIHSVLHYPQADLRRGMILIAVSLAMVILGFVLRAGGGYYEVVWPIVGAAAFPGLIGVASLIMWRLSPKAPRD